MAETGRTTLWTHGSAIQYRWWNDDSAFVKFIHVMPNLDGTTIRLSNSDLPAQKISLFLPLPGLTFIADVGNVKLWHLYFYYTTINGGKITKLDLRQSSGATIIGPFPVTNLPQGTQFSSGIKDGITFFNFDSMGDDPLVGDNTSQNGYCLEIDVTIGPKDSVTIHGAGIEFLHQKFDLD